MKKEIVIAASEGRELAEAELETIAGGKPRYGGPICPSCSSSNVTYDANQGIIYSCRDCGYQNPDRKA